MRQKQKTKQEKKEKKKHKRKMVPPIRVALNLNDWKDLDPRLVRLNVFTCTYRYM